MLIESSFEVCGLPQESRVDGLDLLGGVVPVFDQGSYGGRKAIEIRELRVTMREDEAVGRARIRKLAEEVVFELNHEGIALVEGRKGVVPVLVAQIRLLVRIDFSEELVKHLLAHVETFECIVLFYEGFESREIHLLCSLCCVIEAVPEGGVLL